jgi:hypothetical protein
LYIFQKIFLRQIIGRHSEQSEESVIKYRTKDALLELLFPTDLSSLKMTQQQT